MTMTPMRLLHHLRRLATPAADADAVLLERFAGCRDEAAFTALVARHGPMVLGVCRRLLDDAHAAEDCFQATFLVLARRAAAVGRPDALAGWLYGVARKVALRARHTRDHPQSIADADEPADPRPGPLAELTARDLLAVLDAEVQHLPDLYRLPVVLCCLEGLSQEEVARRLGCTAGAVRGRLERGRKRLHERLARRGLTLAAALATAEVARGVVASALADGTVRAVLSGAAVPGNIAGLMEGVLRAMWMTRLKTAVALLLAVAVLGLGAGSVIHQLGADQGNVDPKQAAPGKVVAQPPQRPPLLELSEADNGKVIWAVIGQEILVRLDYPESDDLTFAGTGTGITQGRCTQYLPQVDPEMVKRYRKAGLAGPRPGFFRFRVTEAGRDKLAVRVFDKGSGRVRDFAVTLEVPPADQEKKQPAKEAGGEKKTERTPADLIRLATADPSGREPYPVLPTLSTTMRGHVTNEIINSAAVRASFAKLDARERNVTWFEGVKELEQHRATWCLTACLCHRSPDDADSLAARPRSGSGDKK